MKSLSVILVALVTMLTAARSQAQPFFGGGVVAFDPEISTVQSGVLTDVQSTVSYDRKYVTITMQAQQSDLLALRPFVFQTSQQGPAVGFVGNVTPTPIVAAGPSESPAEIERRAMASRSVLSRRGMFLLRVN